MAPSQPRRRQQERQQERQRCIYPGCTRPARLGENRGAPPKYCYIDGHTPERGHRTRKRLEAQAARLDVDSEPALLVAEIATLRRKVSGLDAELAAERHHHQTHHPDCPGPGHRDRSEADDSGRDADGR